MFHPPNRPTTNSLNIEKDHSDSHNQGIISILDSDQSQSLSRTVSATNMSSSNMTSFDIWSSIQVQKKNASTTLDKSTPSDLWGSITSSCDTVSAGAALPPPYIHPMVKRSASSLSEKSLEICTESLGSETGSDGFSSYPPSEPDDKDEESDCDEPVEVECWRAFEDADEVRVSTVKYNYSSCRTLLSPVKSFPPPLPSLADRSDGSNLQMWSRRHDGRLVVEAVAVPSQNCFRAQRHDGRLLLTLANATLPPLADEPINIKEEKETEHENSNQEGCEVSVIKGDGMEPKKLKITLMEDYSKLPARMGMTMNVTKLIGLTKTTPWPHRLNKVVTTIEATAVAEEGEEEKSSALQARLGSAVPSNTTVKLNTYECYWRTKPTPVAVLKPLTKKTPSVKAVEGSDGVAVEQQEVLVVKGKKAEYLVPLLRGCKEQRRSLLFWEPYCIATT